LVAIGATFAQQGNDMCNPDTEVFQACGANCEPKCEDGGRPRPCPLICTEPACACKEGFARVGGTGQCVPSNQCLISLGANSSQCDPETEQFSQCGRQCEQACGNTTSVSICPRSCPGPGACACKPGFARNGQQCVNESQCLLLEIEPSNQTQQCDWATEEISACGHMCEPTCTQPSPVCPLLLCMFPDCRCKSGYARNENGTCIPLDQCNDFAPGQYLTSTCNPETEMLKPCGRMCEPTCDNPTPTFCPAMMCLEAQQACSCRPGYLRHPTMGECVTPNQCVLLDVPI